MLSAPTEGRGQKMTSQQFYSTEGQKLMQLEHQKERMLNRAGGYTKGVAKIADRIFKLQEKIKLLYP